MRTWWMVVIGLGFAVFVNEVQAGTSDVYRLDAIFKGVIQAGLTNISPTAQKVQVDTDDLINLGTGRPLGTKVPANEILGLAHDCAFIELRMIVYDTDTSANLATLALIKPDLRVFSLKKDKVTQYSISDVQMLPTENPTNGITGGQLKLTATSTTDTNNCVQSLNGTMIGTLLTSFYTTNTVIFGTNFVDESTMTTNVVVVTNTFVTVVGYDVAVNKATLKSKNKKKVGQLIEP